MINDVILTRSETPATEFVSNITFTIDGIYQQKCGPLASGTLRAAKLQGCKITPGNRNATGGNMEKRRSRFAIVFLSGIAVLLGAGTASTLVALVGPVTVPAGTAITVRMIDGIDSSRNRAGQDFAASVDSPVVVGERVTIPRGADARVRLVEAKGAGHIKGSSLLELELVSLTFGGNTYAVESSLHEQRGASRGKRSAEVIGGGAGLGAVIGAIAGKGKGAAIGAGAGAATGTAVEMATRGQQVKVPSETKVTFTLKNGIKVTP